MGGGGFYQEPGLPGGQEHKPGARSLAAERENLAVEDSAGQGYQHLDQVILLGGPLHVACLAAGGPLKSLVRIKKYVCRLFSCLIGIRVVESCCE